MTTNEKTVLNPLFSHFDNELKKLLAEDLRQFMAKNNFLAAIRQSGNRQVRAIA